jgi:hypothetical protein
MPTRLELYEKYLTEGLYTEDWWRENMPPGTKPPTSYGYRRTMPCLQEIDRPIEIPGNLDECIVRFWTGEEIIIRSNYDDFCIYLHDVEWEEENNE